MRRKYYLVRRGRVEKFLPILQGWSGVVLDCETTGLSPKYGDRLLGFALASVYPEDSDIYYLPVHHPDTPAVYEDTPVENISRDELLMVYAVLDTKPLVGHNIKFDVHALSTEQELNGAALFDVMVAMRLLAKTQHPDLSLDGSAKEYVDFSYARQDVKDKRHLLGKGKFNILDIAYYCCEDVDATRRLYHYSKRTLSPALMRLWGLECRLTRHLLNMERRGIAYSPEAVVALARQVDGLIDNQRAIVCDAFGDEFNPNSAPQKAAALQSLGLKSKNVTPTGNAQWRRADLLATKHPVAHALAQHGALRTLRSTFISEADRCMELHLPAITTTYKNWGTVTGRLASSEPNLQNLPKGYLQLDTIAPDGSELYWSEDGPEFNVSLRSIFRPRPGNGFVLIDYRQIEMFVFGFYAQDEEFLKLLESEDVHGATATAVWGVHKGDDVYSRMRRIAKYINFGLIYGVGNAHLGEMIGCSTAEAKEYRNTYFRKFSGYNRLLSYVQQKLRDKGYVETIFGRQYWLPEDLAYVGLNYICQGSAGDYVKLKMLEINPVCEGLGGHILNTTHDDMLFEIPMQNLPRIGPMLKQLESSPFGRPLALEAKWSLDSLVNMQEWSVESCAEEVERYISSGAVGEGRQDSSRE